MADYDLAYSFLLPHEDYTPPRYEVVPDPVPGKDPNAKAISGINSYFWPVEFKAIVALPFAERGIAVKAFYKKNFWNSWLDQMTSNKVAALILDSSVNQGPGTAVKLLQTACNAVEASSAVVDGHWGPNTLAAANACDSEALAEAFQEARKAKYVATGGDVLPQWLARAGKMPDFA